MPRRFLFLIGMVVLLGFAKAEAQNVVFDTIGNTMITADTVVKETGKTAKVKKSHSPKTATIMSACLPGLGQVYNGKWWKVPIVYAGLGGLGYLVYNNYSEYRSYLHAYEYKTGDLPEGTTLTEHELDLASKYADSQQDSILAFFLDLFLSKLEFIFLSFFKDPFLFSKNGKSIFFIIKVFLNLVFLALSPSNLVFINISNNIT